MKAFKNILIVLLILIVTAYCTGEQSSDYDKIPTQQIRFAPNNIDTWIQNSGIADSDIRYSVTPGFQWPRGSGKFAIFADGLTVGAMVNGGLRMAAASYKGEYAPGYMADSLGRPVARTDIRFKLYKVSRGDSYINNGDWANWGLMVPFGAPYIDVNHNGVYEFAVDTPGVKGASQTVFICMTDGFQSSHYIGEGFGGGTSPLYAELRLTAWGYDNSGYQDMIFKKFELINRNDTAWNSTYTAIIADPDIGDPDDDYIGCDTTRSLGFCYNGDNNDSGSIYSYGINPPAVGFKLLNLNGQSNPGIKAFVYFIYPNASHSQCEVQPQEEPQQAYYMLKGLKKDLTPWVIPPGGNANLITKFCYSGDPETGTGWNEGQPGSPSGSVYNCGGPGYLEGMIVPVNPVGDRRLIMSSGSDNRTVMPNDTVRIIIAELIARGTSNLNSVTKLKQLSDVAQQLCNNGFVIGVNNISYETPNSFVLYQNYPNPFNPATKIKFEIPFSRGVPEGRGVLTKLIIYDALGREITIMVNENLKPGTYEAEWDGTNYPSGVYFYKLTSGNYSEAKRMVLLK